MFASLYFDGASRGNPGNAGCGGVLYNKNNEEIATYTKYLGKQTNNYAEYMGLYHGMMEAHTRNISDLTIYGDSQLIIRQCSGIYKVKNEILKEIYTKVKDLEKLFDSVSYNHVKRNLNQRADELANQSL
jgi:ribonuclease HI